MLFLLFGSSASGKTAATTVLSDRVADLAIHDFDEIGVPWGADTAWRHRANEAWVQRALVYQADGVDLLLAGQTPLGELLAASSATQLEAISACLLDCDNDTRVARLRMRPEDWAAPTGGALQDFLNWADWMRGHAEDPTWEVEVIRIDATEHDMHWSRWSSWKRGDRRWHVTTIDTTARPVEQVADDLASWIAIERELLRSGDHPLTRWATPEEQPR